jgi:hypothetical protein
LECGLVTIGAELAGLMPRIGSVARSATHWDILCCASARANPCISEGVRRQGGLERVRGDLSGGVYPSLA